MNLAQFLNFELAYASGVPVPVQSLNVVQVRNHRLADVPGNCDSRCAVLLALAKVGHPVKQMDLRRPTGLTISCLNMTLARLVFDGKVKRTGRKYRYLFEIAKDEKKLNQASPA